MNDKLESGNNNLTCLFTEFDWKEWEAREDRDRNKIKTPEIKVFIRKNKYNRWWKYGCDLCKSRSNLVRGIKQHYKNTHNKYISGDKIRECYRVRGRVQK